VLSCTQIAHVIDESFSPQNAIESSSSSLSNHHGDAAPRSHNLTAAQLSQIPLIAGDEVHDTALFPPGVTDVHGQQVDNIRNCSLCMC
jgi:hypothetical protein